MKKPATEHPPLFWERLDHLVYVVPDLEKAMLSLEALLGVPFSYGGRHLQQGTHNALLRIGPAAYLELLAIDPENTAIAPPRWMGVDEVKNPQLTRWALRSPKMERDCRILQNIDPAMGHLQAGQRQKSNGKLLQWQLSMPLPRPAVELLPFYIDWSAGTHPAEDLPQHCQIQELRATHPQASLIQENFASLNIDWTIQAGPKIALQTFISSPNGSILL